MRRKLSGAALALLAFATIGMGSGGAAIQVCDVGEECPVDVLLAAIAGTRKLAVTTAVGADLNGGELDLGTAHSGAFVVNVIDASYDHVGYEVTGTLSNLYLKDGAAFDCATRIDSEKVSLAFPVDPQLLALGATIQGTVSLVGTVSADLIAAITAALESLGGPLDAGELAALAGILGTPLAPDDVTAQLEGAAEGLDAALDGADALLPIKVANGNPGNFPNPAAHPECGEGSGAGTTKRLVMSGDASELGDFFDDLVAALGDLVDGVTSAADLIAGGVIDEAEAGAAVAAAIDALSTATGLEIPQTDEVVSQLLDDLIGELGALFEIIGQSGIGVTVPTIDADASDAPAAGIFGGRLTLTLVDVPDGV